MTEKTTEIRALKMPVDSLAPNPWNPNVQSEFTFEKTRGSVRAFGFVDPVTVRTGRETGSLFRKPQIINGEHSWRAAKLEGLTEILVVDVGRMSDEKAKALTELMNMGGDNDPLKFSALVESISAGAPALLDLLPYKRAEIDAALASAKVDFGTSAGGEEAPPAEEPVRAGRDGKLYKKFSVSLPEATMNRASDLMRKIKAVHQVDTDAAAFEELLNLAQGALTAKRPSIVPPPPAEPAPRKRRAVAPSTAE